MTDKEFEKYKNKNTRIYKIWFGKEGNLQEKECKFKDFEDSWMLRSWLNNDIPYDTLDKVEFMYATEDKVNFCAQKLINELMQQQIDIIDKATQKLNAIKRYKRK